jgi:hypothetical protein
MHTNYHTNIFQNLFSLAYPVHPDRPVAQCVVIEGIRNGDDIRATEKKRARATEKKMRAPKKNGPGQVKLTVPDVALPQMGAFIASARRERDQESSQPKMVPIYKPTPADNLPRYLEHLVYRAIDRRPHVMAVALGCNLYAHSPGQIALLSDELFKADNIWRTDGQIKESIQERFPSCVGMHPASASETAVTLNLLPRLAPWVEPHFLPSIWESSLFEAFSPSREALKGPGWNELLWGLNHLLANPKSGGLPRLIQEYNQHAVALRANGFDNVMLLDDPKNTLTAPTFPDGPDATDDRFNPPHLTQNEIKLMEGLLAANNYRRRLYSPGPLRVLVDGREPLNYYEPERLGSHIIVSPDDAYIQVIGEDKEGELPLAVFPVPDLESMEVGEREELFITHPGGQVITCQIEATRDEAGEIEGCVKIAQTAPRRLFPFLSGAVRLLRGLPPHILSPIAVALIVATVMITSFLCLKYRGEEQTVSIVKDGPGSSGARASDNDVLPQPIDMAYNAVGRSLLTPAIHKPGDDAPSSFPQYASDQKAGSVLFYNIYTSTPDSSEAENTRVNITNTNSTTGIAVHLFFVDGATCAVADAFISLTANQTAGFLASDVDPGVTGYFIAVAVSNDGHPIAFNYLIGDGYVRFSSGHAANLSAEVFSADPASSSADLSSTEAVLCINGVSYNIAPRLLAVSNVPSRTDGNDTLVVINRGGGDLATDTATPGILFGLLYDDAENVLSLSTNTVTVRAKPLPPTAGHSGWERLSKAIGVSALKETLGSLRRGEGSENQSGGTRVLDNSPRTMSIKLAIPVIPPSSYGG